MTSATGVSQSEIDLTWTDGAGPGGTATSYTIQRAPDDGSSPPNWQSLPTIMAPASSYPDTSGLTADTSYLYRMSASNAWGTSDFSNTATGTTLPNPPAAPLAFTAVASPTSATQVNLMWQPSGDSLQTGYTIERSLTGNPNSDADWHVVLNPGASAVTATDSTCQPATTYYYRIRAVNRGGASAWVYASAVTTLTPPLPSTPTNFTVTGVTSTEIDLSWTDPRANASDGSRATGFQLQRHPGASDPSYPASGWTTLPSLPATPTTYADTGLTPSSTYTYRIRSSNAAGYSGYSTDVTATTLPGSQTSPGSDAPAHVIAAPTGDGKITVYWDVVANALGYNVYRGTSSGGEDYSNPANGGQIVTTLNFPGATVYSFTDTGLVDGNHYFYTVRPVYEAGQMGSISAEDDEVVDRETGTGTCDSVASDRRFRSKTRSL